MSAIISLRQRLLKMRYITPDLLNEEIPLLEKEVRLSKKLMDFIDEDNIQNNYDLEVER